MAMSFAGFRFPEGKKDFFETIFGDGDVSFFGATFGEGNVNCFDATFGDGDVNLTRHSARLCELPRRDVR